MSEKVKVKGSITEVKPVEIDIYTEELVKAAMPHMSVDDIIRVLKNQLEIKFKKNDKSLPKTAQIDWYRKKWEKYSFTDYHKNDDVYTDIRPFNEEELEYLLAVESLYHVLNN